MCIRDRYYTLYAFFVKYLYHSVKIYGVCVHFVFIVVVVVILYIDVITIIR